MPLPRSALKTSTQLSTGLNNSPGSSTSRIRVVIRVRPLSTGESKQGHKCTVERRNDQQFTVWDPAVFEFSNHDAFSEMDPSCWSRSFTFDDCLLFLKYPKQISETISICIGPHGYYMKSLGKNYSLPKDPQKHTLELCETIIRQSKK